MKAMMGWGALAAALAIGLASAEPVRAASDLSEPSPRDRQTIYDCLENARGMERLKIGALCIGAVSTTCTEIPANQSTHGMSACYAKEKVIWDELLNDWYKSARENMSGEVKTLLRDAQRQWIKWRDAKCDFAYGQFLGGTLGIPVSSYCVMETTATRALELRELVIEYESR